MLGAVEHLVGLQAQDVKAPYVALWSRVAGFDPYELGRMLESREVVRLPLMRDTVHLVSADDALALRPLVQPPIEAHGRGSLGPPPEVDRAELAALARTAFEEAPRTAGELRALFAERWPGADPERLARGVRADLPLMQLPPRAVWRRPGSVRHGLLERELGRPMRPTTLADMVRRYLGAFGPASVADVQTWSGLTRLAEVADGMDDLVRLRDEDGRELLDLPDAPRPGSDVPAPVRFLAPWDQVLLSHADRSRIISAEQQRVMSVAPNGRMPCAVLVDGRVGGLWRVESGAVVVEGFGPLPDDEVGREAAALEEFLRR
ncbi:winged helix DNA-binding protein [Motilibacter rhizosphaerae]|uniref:Winged helix DNA-binding protein n=1 Tax=Motilibacter rhizosphaerae TaxID=598652 RepID=A0A4Q7NV48_9ACTN|nr:winged helix DNA-binding domain-containing protein [Motilibacter rhizosphaerae]RZS90820.1 winged helix DNA-binding protein [Motilibacter rhizosphaerae]